MNSAAGIKNLFKQVACEPNNVFLTHLPITACEFIRFSDKISFIWSVAGSLRGRYRPKPYKCVMWLKTVLLERGTTAHVTHRLQRSLK